MNSKIIFLLLVVFAITETIAQDISRVWRQEIINEGAQTKSLYSAADDSDVTYYIVSVVEGFSQTYFLNAIDADGIEVYSVEAPSPNEGNQVHIVDRMVLDSANDFIYITGTNQSSDRVVISRFQKSTGEFISSSATESSGGIQTIPYSLAVDINGDILVSTAFGAPSKFRITRFLAEGGIGWDIVYDNKNGAIPRDLKINPDNGDIYVAGETRSIKTYLMAISNSGDFLWDVDDSTNPEAQAMILTEDGDIVIVGSGAAFNTPFIKKYDTDGNLIWMGEGSNGETTFGVIEYPGEGFFTCGANVYFHNNSIISDLTISAYDPEGIYLWSYIEEDFDESSIAHSINLLTNNTMVAVGNIAVDDGNEVIKTAHVSNYSFQPLSIGELPFNDTFTVYPNPTKDVLNIRVENATQDRLQYSISNMLGQNLLTGMLGNDLQDQTINIAGLAKGTYLLSLKSNEGTFSRKIMIE